MKKNLILTLIAGIILVTVYSFVPVKPSHKKHAVKAKTAKPFTCGSAVKTVTGIYNGPWSITLSWTYDNTLPAPDHYTYGGNFFCPSNFPGHFGTTSTGSTSVTLSIPFSTDCPNGYSGVNGRIIPICADGTEGTGKLFSITH